MNQQEALKAIAEQIDASAILLNKKADEVSRTPNHHHPDHNAPQNALEELGEISFLVKREIEAPNEEYPTALIAPCLRGC